MKVLLAIILSCLGWGQLFGQTAQVPKEKIPQGILDQLKLIQADFVIALQKDCGDQGCYPRGCVYAGHEVVSLQGDQTLPGLASESKARASSEPQYILTAVNCEYAYEDSLQEKDIQNLSKRLSTKLSNGVLRVNARGAAIPAGLVKAEVSLQTQSRAEKIEALLLQYFSWILAFVLLSLATLIGIWSWRRLGRDTKDEELHHELLRKKLEREAAELSPVTESEPEPQVDSQIHERLQKILPLLQQKPAVLHKQCLQWLGAEDFSSLATTLLLMAPYAPLSLVTGPEHILLKLRFSRFAERFTPDTEKKLEILNFLERDVALRLQIDDDGAEQIQRFFRYYSPEAIAHYIEKQSLEAKRSLLALAPGLMARDIVSHLSEGSKVKLALSFWSSDRVALDALKTWEVASEKMLEGQAPASMNPSTDGPSLTINATVLLSMLLPQIPVLERQSLQNTGFNPWTRQVFYAEMLRGLPLDRARDVLLSCDSQSLGHWYRSLGISEQKLVWDILPQSYRQQIQASGIDSYNPDIVLDVVRICGRAFNQQLQQEENRVEELA